VFPEIILGPLLVIVGALIILGRGVLPGIVHAGLKMIYGEPVADDAMRLNPKLHLTVVGIIFIIGGIVVTVLAFV